MVEHIKGFKRCLEVCCLVVGGFQSPTLNQLDNTRISTCCLKGKSLVINAEQVSIFSHGHLFAIKKGFNLKAESFVCANYNVLVDVFGLNLPYLLNSSCDYGFTIDEVRVLSLDCRSEHKDVVHW